MAGSLTCTEVGGGERGGREREVCDCRYKANLVLDEILKEFDENAELGGAFRALAIYIAEVTGKDENTIDAPFMHRNRIRDFIKDTYYKGVKDGALIIK